MWLELSLWAYLRSTSYGRKSELRAGRMWWRRFRRS
jgi:hypothetical protein